jgi:hypothetical protein
MYWLFKLFKNIIQNRVGGVMEDLKKTVIFIWALVASSSLAWAMENTATVPTQDVKQEAAFKAPEVAQRQKQAESKVAEKNMLSASSEAVTPSSVSNQLIGSGLSLSVRTPTQPYYSIFIGDNITQGNSILIQTRDFRGFPGHGHLINKDTGVIDGYQPNTPEWMAAKNSALSYLNIALQNTTDEKVKSDIKFIIGLIGHLSSETNTSFSSYSGNSVSPYYADFEVNRVSNILRVNDLRPHSSGQYASYTMNLKTKTISYEVDGVTTVIKPSNPAWRTTLNAMIASITSARAASTNAGDIQRLTSTLNLLGTF